MLAKADALRVPSAGSGDLLPNFDQTYITARQLAAELRMSLRTLQRLHERRLGPKRIAIGHTILYRRTTVDEWLRNSEENPVPSTSKRSSLPTAPTTARKRNRRREEMNARRAKTRAAQ